MTFNIAPDFGPKWDWIPIGWVFGLPPFSNHFLFLGRVSLLPRFNVTWHFGFGSRSREHFRIERRTIREAVRDFYKQQWD